MAAAGGSVIRQFDNCDLTWRWIFDKGIGPREIPTVFTLGGGSDLYDNKDDGAEVNAVVVPGVTYEMAAYWLTGNPTDGLDLFESSARELGCFMCLLTDLDEFATEGWTVPGSEVEMIPFDEGDLRPDW